MKSLKEYQAMTPAQLLEDPDAPESLKIGAQIALDNEGQKQKTLTDAARIERMAYARDRKDRQETSR